MPNGLKCYVVTNPFLKGTADVALIQNTGSKSAPNLGGERLCEISRDGLTAQKRLLSPSVQDFFTSLGAIASKDGFVNVTEDATIYHFRNVNFSASEVFLFSDEERLKIANQWKEECYQTERELVDYYYYHKRI